MWLIKITILLVSIQSIITTKDEHLALEEIRNEFAELAQRANNHVYDFEVHSDGTSPMMVAVWIWKRDLDYPKVFEPYREMDISEGLEGQKELLALVEEEKKSGYSEEIADNVLEGFEELDGFADLRETLVGLDAKKIKEKVDFLERKKREFGLSDRGELNDLLNRLKIYLVGAEIHIRRHIKDYPTAMKGPVRKNDDYYERIEAIYITLSQAMDSSERILGMFNRAGQLDNPDIFHPFQALEKVTDEVFSKMGTIKNWNALSSNLTLLEEEIARLLRLKEQLKDPDIKKKKQKGETEKPHIKKALEDLDRNLPELRDFSIFEDVYKRYQGVQSLQTLLEKIRSVTSFMNSVEPKVLKISETWKPFQEYFGNLKISDDVSAEKFAALRECLQKFNFSKEISRDQLDDFRPLFQRVEDAATRLKEHLEILMKFKDSPQLEAFMKYKEPEDLDDKVPEILKILEKDVEQLRDWTEMYKHNPEKLENAARTLLSNVDILLLRSLDDFALTSTEQFEGLKQLLMCYENMGVTSSQIKSIVDSTKDKWNFDPQVLETTVEVIGIFKEAEVKVAEIYNWKRAGYNRSDYTPYPRFVFLRAGLEQNITVPLKALESIWTVQKMWENLKDLDIQNEHWGYLSDAMTKFFVHLSKLDSKSDLVKFFEEEEPLLIRQFDYHLKNPTTKFIEEDYEGNQKTEILNLLEEIEQLVLQYPTADMMKNLNETMEKMKKWEEKRKPKMEKDLTFVDCLENPCDVNLKLPEVGPDAPVKEVVLEDEKKKIQ